MKYLILIYSNPESRAIWDGLSADQHAEGLDYYAGITEEFKASGELIAASPLADVSLAKRVTVREGQITTTDGPYAEVKEYLAGFYLVDCDSAERAIEIAARLPEAEYGLIEVRPTRELSDFLAE